MRFSVLITTGQSQTATPAKRLLTKSKECGAKRSPCEPNVIRAKRGRATRRVAKPEGCVTPRRLHGGKGVGGCLTPTETRSVAESEA